MRGSGPQRIVVAVVLSSGCGESRDASTALDVSVPKTDALALATDLRFEDGLHVTNVQVSPATATPGATLRLSFEVEHGSGPAVLALEPPRSASRQVALGGPDAPPASAPPDPRTASVDVALKPGSNEVQVRVPEPWHPRRAVLTLTRADGGETPALQGPRTESGRAILAVVDVQTRPTEVTAVKGTPQIDGSLADSLWDGAVFTPLVDSLEGEPVEPRTEVAFAWDADALYAAARMTDADIWSEYRQHDDPLWKQEVFELFVFGDEGRTDYLELQVSPRGTRFDARFEVHRKGDDGWDGTWRSAVSVDGTVDRRDDVDRGWTAELAIPWTEICEHTEVSCPPGEGDTLRVNAFRLERPDEGATVGMALSPTRVPDFHAASNAAVVQLGGAGRR